MKSYIPYHMHTEYSLLDSCEKPQAYIDLAVRDGARAISFSEHGKPLNWCEKWAACRKAGLRYIHSVEIYLTESLTPKVRDNYHTVLMARNWDGVLELNELVSRSCDKEHFYYVNRLSFDEFLHMSGNILSTSACLASPLNKLSPRHPRFLELVSKYDFLEVQPHNHPEQAAFNRRLAKISAAFDKPLIAGTDTHSSTPYKAECRAVLLSAKHKSYGDEDAFDLTYKTYDELFEMFRLQGALSEKEIETALDNTNLLLDKTEDFSLDTSIKYPILYGSREEDAKRLSTRVENGFAEKCETGVIPKEQRPAFRAAIDEEMRVFHKLGMEGYMLSESELVGWCKEQGMAVGMARGSVGGSRVAYVTDITDLNPETWHTVFSRFCNEDREEIGDIDIDCVESDRPAIFEYIIGRFGKDKTARVASFGTMQSKGVMDDVGRHLARKWKEEHAESDGENPWSLSRIAQIKNEFDADEEGTKKKYPELFRYYDGLLGTKISQGVHPAGMVISPVTLPDNYGVFDKDGESCLFLDMDNVHDFTGLAKYDFLLLSTVQIIRDTCRAIGKPYPKSHEVNWDDREVWEDMLRHPFGLFQVSGDYAFQSMRKFAPRNIFELSLVTACIRPSGASYRDDLLRRKPRKNPSALIDDLLKDNLGYLIYQEDTIKFLQEICGLSGGEADNIRRAIGRKQKDRLEAALPSILEGYCRKSPKPREEAEEEAKAFLRVIEDSASYQFNYNHSIAYCMLTYLCAYYRHYAPLPFITAFLNNAANDEDIQSGTAYAASIGVPITMPKWGVSLGDYAFDAERNVIAKGLSSVKYMGSTVADELYRLSHGKTYTAFTDVLWDIARQTSLNSRQLDILIRLDFFSDFGNRRELLCIAEMFSGLFRNGEVKKISRDKVDGTILEPVMQRYAIGMTKSGGVSKCYTLLDVPSALRESEKAVRALHLPDMSDTQKAADFAEIMGYPGYVTGKEEDRRKLYVLDIVPVKRKSDGKRFGYSVFTKSVGSGKESRFTVLDRVFAKEPIAKGDIVFCRDYTKDGKYYRLNEYTKLT